MNDDELQRLREHGVHSPDEVRALFDEVMCLRAENQRQARYIRIVQEHLSASALAYLARLTEDAP